MSLSPNSIHIQIAPGIINQFCDLRKRVHPSMSVIPGLTIKTHAALMSALVFRPTPGQSQWSWISLLPNREDALSGCGIGCGVQAFGFYSSRCTRGPFGEFFVCFIHVRKSVRISPSLAAFLHNRESRQIQHPNKSSEHHRSVLSFSQNNLSGIPI